MDLVKVFASADSSNKMPINIRGTLECPLFQANQIGSLLEIVKVRNTINNFPAVEKVSLVVETAGGEQEATFLTEAGLYRLIFKSNKPVAETFKQWVFEVIKEVRLTGRYDLEQALKKSTGDIATLETRLLANVREQRMIYRREQHSLLLEVHHCKNVVYVVLILEEGDVVIIKVGHTTDIRERVREHGCTYGKTATLLFAFVANQNSELETRLFHLPIFVQHRYNQTVNGKISKEHFKVQNEGSFTLENIFDIIRREGRDYQHLDQELYIRQQEVNLQASKLAFERDLFEAEKRKLAEVSHHKRFEEVDMDRLFIQLQQHTDAIAKIVEGLKPLQVERALSQSKNAVVKETNIEANSVVANAIVEKPLAVETNAVVPAALFVSETRSSPVGPYVQKLDRDSFEIIAYYEGITEAVRKESLSGISIAGVKGAVKKHSVYNGYRWLFVDRTLDPSVKHEVPPTSTKVRYVVKGWVAQLNYMKTEITAVYKDQKGAALANGFKGRTAISLSVKKGNAAGRSYYVLWDTCAIELRNAFTERHGEVYFAPKTVIDEYDLTGKLVASYVSKQDIVNKLAIGQNKLRAMLDSGESYKGRIFKRTAEDDPESDLQEDEEKEE